jgi:branched-chain amino acid transport system substrate-binding protein
LSHLPPDMAAGAELAFSEASNSGDLLGGAQYNSVIRADSTCVDSAAASSAAEGLVSSRECLQLWVLIVPVLLAQLLSNVAIPNGVPMISPSATSPALTSCR